MMPMQVSALFLATIQWRLSAIWADEPHAGTVQYSFNCTEHLRNFSITANYSWQAVAVRAANGSFAGQCSVYVNVSSDVAGEQLLKGQYHRNPPALLLKIEQLLVGTAADGACDGIGNSLNVFTQNNRSGNAGYICNVSTVYMWSNDTIELYMYIGNKSSSASSFVASFIAVADVIEACVVGSTELRIDSELYVFAPNYRYSGIPPNNANCTNASYTLLASSSSHGLSVSVLAAPQSDSCCSLMLGGQNCTSQCTQNVAPGERSLLQYSCRACGDKDHSGFTLRASVNTTVTSAAVATTTWGGEVSSVTQLLSSSPPSTVRSQSTSMLQSTESSALFTTWRSSTLSRPVEESSSFYGTNFVTRGSDAVPGITASYSPAFTLSRSSSANLSGDDALSTSSSSSHVPLIVGAVVGTLVFVAIVVTAATITAKRGRRLRRSKADTARECGRIDDLTAHPSVQPPSPLVGSKPAHQKSIDVSAADLDVAMVDNDLYVATQGGK